MTSGQDSERGRRKELVTLSVIAGSALSLAATWVGIAAVDGAQSEVAVETTVASAPTTSVAASTGAPAAQAQASSGATSTAATPTAAANAVTATSTATPTATATLLVPVPTQTQAPTQSVQPVRRSRAS
ncbi:MAG: hypothetical protein IT299_09235 [Dehalococcoidia bacterium]|nr:hypothetical protein [Dehalococcoidia bacterium]